MATTYRIEVKAQTWAGSIRRGWRPAIAGALNSTSHESDEQASQFDSLDDAREAMEFVVHEEPDEARIVSSDGNIECEWVAGAGFVT